MNANADRLEHLFTRALDGAASHDERDLLDTLLRDESVRARFEAYAALDDAVGGALRADFDRAAALAHNTGAPVYPSLPATMSSRPKSPLCAERRRGGNNGFTSAAVINSTSARTSRLSNPMSATTISPTTSGARNKSTFGNPIVTVSVARTQVAVPKPDGTSIATTGAVCSLMYRMADANGSRTSPLKPVPNNPSSTTAGRAGPRFGNGQS